MISLLTPKGGINFNEVDNPSVLKVMNNYMVSKSGDVFLAAESAKKSGNDGILSVSLHPGMMRAELQRHISAIKLVGTVFKPLQFGAYTELHAGFSDATAADNGGVFIP
ncbi:uncharacterized protein K441DRAFT_735357 [Cenococcum geophilum 1.58]|uniref:uncharacterized protein n=1 Tax=Cenococcum geophilum 1.58 TaxID=794803 RepID=UPI00358F1BEE|nr:hypothetical protein K441DRAFT_735357 [Cenococcum geophilum 1.58]